MGPSKQLVHLWGEHHAELVLSLHGFDVLELPRVGEGISFIAKNKSNNDLPEETLGKLFAFFVISRCRRKGKERENYRVEIKSVEKLMKATKNLPLANESPIPYLAFVRYSEFDRSTDVFLLAVSDIPEYQKQLPKEKQGGEQTWNFYPEILSTRGILRLK